LGSGKGKMMEISTICPYCLKKHELTSAVVDKAATPKPGNVSMCITCGEFSIFNTALVLEKLTPEQRVELDQHPGIQQIRRAWRLASTAENKS
jgi:hypothetical protein